MTATSFSPPPSQGSAHRSDRRPLWRQRLVQAERGLSWGLKGDSIFYVYGFLASIITVAGLVIGLELMHWAVLVLAWTGVVAAEMFNQVVRRLAQPAEGEPLPERTRQSLAGAQAAVMLVLVGGLSAAGLVFVERLAGKW